MKHRWHAGSEAPGRKWWMGLGGVAGCLLCLAAPAYAVVTAPFDGESLLSGESYTIQWDPLGSCSTVDIQLYSGTRFICMVATGVPDDGTYDWTVDLCESPPACNLRVRIGCTGESVWSSPFAISGLLLESVDAGSRNVQLTWTRARGDTLGAVNAETDSTTRRIFGGYNIWRRVYDNRLDESITDRFTKLRTYDVAHFGADTVSSAWTFVQPAARFGPVVVDIDEDTSETQTWVAAQTFTTPPDSTVDICRVRIYHSSIFHRFTVRARIVPVDAMGLPDLSATPLANVTQTVGSLNQQAGFRWITYTCPAPAVLNAGTTYAIVFTADSNSGPPRDRRMTWTRARFDAFAGGTAVVSTDGGATWEIQSDADFAFVLGGNAVGTFGAACVDWRGQRRGGDLIRFFNDPDSILAFGRDEEGALVELNPTGPFNGFQLEYAVTMFERVLLTSGNTEKPSPCEDTLFTSDDFPLGVQPSAQAVWPDLIFPESAQQTTSPLLRDVYPVPNPYVRDAASPSFPRWERPGERRIEFFNLPAGARIRIYTLAGDHVRTFEHTGERGSASWDLRNESGEIVVSGVYIWMVTTDTGETKRGQLVIVR